MEDCGRYRADCCFLWHMQNMQIFQKIHCIKIHDVKKRRRKRQQIWAQSHIWEGCHARATLLVLPLGTKLRNWPCFGSLSTTNYCFSIGSVSFTTATSNRLNNYLQGRMVPGVKNLQVGQHAYSRKLIETRLLLWSWRVLDCYISCLFFGLTLPGFHTSSDMYELSKSIC